MAPAVETLGSGDGPEFLVAGDRSDLCAAESDYSSVTESTITLSVPKTAAAAKTAWMQFPTYLAGPDDHAPRTYGRTRAQTRSLGRRSSVLDHGGVDAVKIIMTLGEQMDKR